MNGKMYVFKPGDNTVQITILTAAPDLATLQKAVGGFIEKVPGLDIFTDVATPAVAFCDEEGKLKRLAVNKHANMLWLFALNATRRQEGKKPGSHLTDSLCGPVVVLTGDAEFMESL